VRNAEVEGSTPFRSTGRHPLTALSATAGKRRVPTAPTQARRYLALACDFDGTLAHDGVVENDVIEALLRYRRTGRKLLMVTGRELADLRTTFSRLDLFEQIVAENGATLYRPATGDERALTQPPAKSFVDALRERGVSPLSAGRAIV